MASAVSSFQHCTGTACVLRAIYSYYLKICYLLMAMTNIPTKFQSLTSFMYLIIDNLQCLFLTLVHLGLVLSRKILTGDNVLCKNLHLLRRKNVKPSQKNSIFVTLRGSFQNFQPAPILFLCKSATHTPPFPGSKPSVLGCATILLQHCLHILVLNFYMECFMNDSIASIRMRYSSC